MIYEPYCGPIDRDSARKVPPEKLRAVYESMLRIRVAEEKVADLVKAGEIICPCHLYIGQEAVAAGVCASLGPDDYVYSTHRSHGHYLAKGGSLDGMMAELYGKATGCSRGYGGSMHLCAPEVGFPGSSAIVAGTIPLALGSALAFSIQGAGLVSVAFFGDGAATEGVFYESMNLAALRRLPVVFVCENNFYSTHMHISSIQSDTEVYKKALAFGMPSRRLDGNNAVEVMQAAEEAVQRARKGEGPTLLECVTYRWRGHVGPNWDIEKMLRSREEVDWWMNNCAIKRMEALLIQMGIITGEESRALTERAAAETESALRAAKDAPLPDATGYMKNIFKEGNGQ